MFPFYFYSLCVYILISSFILILLFFIHCVIIISIYVLNEKFFSLSLIRIFFVWQWARVRGTSFIFCLVWKRHSSRLEVGLGVLVMVTMKITVFLFLSW